MSFDLPARYKMPGKTPRGFLAEHVEGAEIAKPGVADKMKPAAIVSADTILCFPRVLRAMLNMQTALFPCIVSGERYHLPPHTLSGLQWWW